MSWPLAVLILMVLFALLGAAFADSLWGSARATPAPLDTTSQIVTAACPDRECGRGIIDTGLGTQRPTTTARNH
jgi:hypothetical protein